MRGSGRSVQRFRGGLVFEAHRLLYHSTLGLRVIKQKKVGADRELEAVVAAGRSGRGRRVLRVCV